MSKAANKQALIPKHITQASGIQDEKMLTMQYKKTVVECKPFWIIKISKTICLTKAAFNKKTTCSAAKKIPI